MKRESNAKWRTSDAERLNLPEKTTTRISSDVDNSADDKTKVGETRYGKDLLVVRGRNGRLFVVHMVGGGTLPPELSGSWTDYYAAKLAVESYIDSHKGRKCPAST